MHMEMEELAVQVPICITTKEVIETPYMSSRKGSC